MCEVDCHLINCGYKLAQNVGALYKNTGFGTGQGRQRIRVDRECPLSSSGPSEYTAIIYTT